MKPMTIKASKNLLLVATVVTILNFQSCKKYDDGPGFSLRSVTKRLTGKWEVTDIQGQGSPDHKVFIEFEKDGDFKVTHEESSYFYNGYSYNYSDTYNGEWSFEDGKRTIELDYDNEGSEECEIKRLTNSEFWFEDEDNTEYELEKI
jgi:hypothetical protein